MAYIGYTPQIYHVVCATKNVNTVKWDFVESSTVSKFNIYRADKDGFTYIYNLIASVNYLDVHGNESYYSYADSITDIQSTSRAYKITGVDTNGVESSIDSAYDHMPPSRNNYDWFSPYWKTTWGYDTVVFYNVKVYKSDDTLLIEIPYLINTPGDYLLKELPNSCYITYSDTRSADINIYTTSGTHTVDLMEGSLPSEKVSIIPDMTSNTTPSGVVSASGQYSAYLFLYAVDANTSNSWICKMTSSPAWIKYDNVTTANAKSYYILPQMWGVTNRSPNAFELYGSNDDSNWDMLDQRVVNASEWDDSYNSTGKGIEFDIPTANVGDYRYYKLSIDTVCGSTLLSLRHFAVFE